MNLPSVSVIDGLLRSLHPARRICTLCFRSSGDRVSGLTYRRLSFRTCGRHTRFAGREALRFDRFRNRPFAALCATAKWPKTLFLSGLRGNTVYPVVVFQTLAPAFLDVKVSLKYTEMTVKKCEQNKISAINEQQFSSRSVNQKNKKAKLQ